MSLSPEEFLDRVLAAKALDETKGRAALTVYAKLQAMGAPFSFGDFLVERGLLTQQAVDTFSADSVANVKTVDTVGDFQLTELLGEGANGSVFRAHQLSLNRDVALKILNHDAAQDPAAVESFLNEARTVAKLNHPNVVRSLAVGSDQGLHYFAMELLEGGSARSLMEEHGGHLPERRALEIIQQAAAGLDAAHTAGMLHRDIKPENIMLTADGQAKLTDLGLAHITEMEGGAFWGSPGYVAPEVISGEVDNDPRSDIYSLGASLFELLVGSPPYLGEDPAEVLRQQLHEEPLDVAELCPGLNPRTISLVRLMLARDPVQRVRSAAVVVQAIAKILAELNAAPARPAPSARPANVPQARPQVPLQPKRPLLKRPVVPGRVIRRPLPPGRHATPSAGAKLFDISAPPPPRTSPQARPGPLRPGQQRPPRRP